MTQTESLAFAAQSGIGHLTTSLDGRIESTLIPFLIEDEPTCPTIYGHLSISNLQARSVEDGAEALLIVDGPIAYVSPNLYPTKDENGKVVPTLNYVSVQIRGRLAPVPNTESLHKLLAALTARFEAEQDKPWSIDDAPSDFIHTQMKAIRGFSLRVDEIQGVAKHSQNRPEPDRYSVRTAFMSGADDERQIAERMI